MSKTLSREGHFRKKSGFLKQLLKYVENIQQQKFRLAPPAPKEVMAFLFVTTIQGYSRVGGNILVKQVKICDEQ